MSLRQIKVTLCSHWGTDRSVAEGAWASSYDKEKAEARSVEDVVRVVTNVINNGHTTPYERVWLEFFLTLPIHTERQLDKTRMSVQQQDYRIEWEQGDFGRHGTAQSELSGRYRTIPDRPYLLPQDVADICGKALYAEDQHHPREQWYQSATDASLEVTNRFNKFLQEQHTRYQSLLTELRKAEKDGVITNQEYKRAREVLRGMLGTAYLTDMRIVLNFNALEHVVNQRLAKDAQLESRVVAFHMVEQLRANNVAPVMLEEMIKKNNWAPLLNEVHAILAALPE